MKSITRYEADDNSIWKTKKEALERDNLLKEVNKAVKKLYDPLEDPYCTFANGSGYIQHNLNDILEVKQNLIELTYPFLKDWMDKQTAPLIDCHPSWFMRLLDGSVYPLEAAWDRIACIDKNGREWGQQYFVEHSNEAKQICLLDYSNK